jgi:DNA-binding MarR family transcriptional regulator
MTDTSSSNDPLQADLEAIERTMLQLGWATHRQLAQELAEFNLTVPQYTAMKALQNTGDNRTMSELADAARQISATMTGIVDRLVERGLLTRQRDPADRRAVRITLTEDGRQLLDAIQQKKRIRLRQFLEQLTPAERHDFVRLVEKYLNVVYG